MNCINCYQELPAGAKFCPHCGAKQPVSGAAHMQAPSQEAASQVQQNANADAEATEKKVTDELQIEETVEKVADTTTEQETKTVETDTVAGMSAEAATGEKVQDVTETGAVEEQQTAEHPQDNSQVAAEVVPKEQSTDQNAYDYQYGQQSNNQDPYSQQAGNQDPYSQQNYSQNDCNQQGYGQNNYGQNNYNQNGYNQNDYNNYNQSNYGQPNYGQNYNQPNYNQQKPLNWVPYLVLSIISTVCCCLPFGIVAIVFSAKINSAMAAGNIEEAQHAAKNAKIWIIVAFAVGIVVNIITFMLGMTGIVGEYYYY